MRTILVWNRGHHVDTSAQYTMMGRVEKLHQTIQHIERSRSWIRNTVDPWQPLSLLDTLSIRIPWLRNGRLRILFHLNSQLPLSLLLVKLPPYLIGCGTIIKHRPTSHSHALSSIEALLVSFSRSAVLGEPRSMVLISRRSFNDVVEVDCWTLVADVACLLY